MPGTAVLPRQLAGPYTFSTVATLVAAGRLGGPATIGSEINS